MKNCILRNKTKIIFLVAAACIFLAAAWSMAKSNNDQGKISTNSETTAPPTANKHDIRWSKAILTVSNMSCGGCIDNIKKGVAAVAGTGMVYVDLTSASAEVLYDDQRLTDPQAIAQAITDSGYPAKIRQLISSQILRKEMDEAADQAKANIARVGRIDIARMDFEIELKHARSRYEKIYGVDAFSSTRGKKLLERIKAQIALGLIEEATKLQEVVQAGYTLPEERVKSAMEDYAKEKNITISQLERDVKDNGYPFDYFKRKFSQRVRLQDYLEDKILAGSIDADQRQQRYRNWLSNTRALAKVVYYDKNLEALIKANRGGGCGGTSCSVSR